MGRKKKPKPLTQPQREIMGGLYERCCSISDKLSEYQTVARKYQTAVEMGLKQALEEEILSEIEAESILLLQEVIEALEEYRVPPSRVVELRNLIPEEHHDLFPTITVGGHPL